MSTVKAFISAGIRQRVIALFDNDTGAAEAILSLQRIHIPPTMKIVQLPRIELGRAYPAIGPQGTVVMDVNGLAGSLELYFGRDVLAKLRLVSFRRSNGAATAKRLVDTRGS